MKLSLLLVSVFLTTIFAGCGGNPTLVGHWVGEVREEEYVAFTRWHIDRQSDGSYTVVFRNFRKDGSYYDNRETGTWKIEGDYYLTTTNTVETVGRTAPRSVHYEERYKILNLSAENFSYQNQKSETVYSVRRVPASYELPTK